MHPTDPNKRTERDKEAPSARPITTSGKNQPTCRMSILDYVREEAPRFVVPSTMCLLCGELLTAAPVSIDPCVVASFHETVFEGSEVEGALGRRCRYTKGRGRKHLLGVDAHHKALAQKA